MIIKIHHAYRDIVALCDSDLLGKVLEEGKFRLEVKENFFFGKKISEDEAFEIIIDMAREDATFYIVGERSVKLALKAGIIHKDGIKTIQDIPVALVLM